MSDTGIKMETVKPSFFAMIPSGVIRRMIGEQLSVHAKWLYVFFMDVAGNSGYSWYGARKISELSGMSTGKISSCKRELVEAGLITVKSRKNESDLITVRDVWGINEKAMKGGVVTT